MGILRDGLVFGAMIAIIVVAVNIFFLNRVLDAKDIVLAFIQFITIAIIVFWFIEPKKKKLVQKD